MHINRVLGSQSPTSLVSMLRIESNYHQLIKLKQWPRFLPLFQCTLFRPDDEVSRVEL
jgi:hypothetical protein